LILGVVQLRVILGPEDERAPSTCIFMIFSKFTAGKIAKFLPRPTAAVIHF
jgi:hypothetical protein